MIVLLLGVGIERFFLITGVLECWSTGVRECWSALLLRSKLLAGSIAECGIFVSCFGWHSSRLPRFVGSFLSSTGLKISSMAPRSRSKTSDGSLRVFLSKRRGKPVSVSPRRRRKKQSFRIKSA